MPLPAAPVLITLGEGVGVSPYQLQPPQTEITPEKFAPTRITAGREPLSQTRMTKKDKNDKYNSYFKSKGQHTKKAVEANPGPKKGGSPANKANTR